MAIWDIKERYKKVRANEIRGDTGLFMGGETPSYLNTIDFVTMSSTGDAADFGDLVSVKGRMPAGLSSSTRGIAAGGNTSPTRLATIDALTISSKGNAFDFGDLASVAQNSRGAGSNVIGFINLGDVSDSASNVINKIIFSSIGNAVDFGDLTAGIKNHAASSSPTRGVSGGGYGPGYSNVID